MFKFYLASVLIWWVVIMLTLRFCAEKVNENGWLDDMEIETPYQFNPGFTSMLMVLAVSAVPILRVIFEAYTIMMASMTPDEYMEWRNRH